MKDSTREKIKKAALEIFSEEGFKGATTRGIAKAADVNESTVFRIFGSKDKLFKEILSENSRMMTIINIIVEGSSASDLRDRLKKITDLFSQMYQSNQMAMRVFLRCAIDQEEMDYLNDNIGPGAYKYMEEYFRRLDESNRISLKMKPENAAFYFLSLVHGSLQRKMMFKNSDISIDTWELVDLFIDGAME